MRITMLVDGLGFELTVRPDGQYVIYGPMYPGKPSYGIFAVGRLKSQGFLFPNLIRSMEKLIIEKYRNEK